MDVKNYLEKVAYNELVEMPGSDQIANVYKSKFDDSYITMVGMEDDVKFLANREITEQLTHGVGFSPKYNKWYGWSHRGICGFTIGSICKKGDCAYKPRDAEEERQRCELFWSDPGNKNVCSRFVRKGLIVTRSERVSKVDEVFNYWFKYPQLEMSWKLRMFWRYGILETLKSFEIMKIKLDYFKFAWKHPFTPRKDNLSVYSEYDDSIFGRGEWTAETMEDAKEMATTYCSEIG